MAKSREIPHSITARQSFLAWRLCKWSVAVNVILVMMIISVVAWSVRFNPPVYIASSNRLDYTFLKPAVLPRGGHLKLVDKLYREEEDGVSEQEEKTGNDEETGTKAKAEK